MHFQRIHFASSCLPRSAHNPFFRSAPTCLSAIPKRTPSSHLSVSLTHPRSISLSVSLSHLSTSSLFSFCVKNTLRVYGCHSRSDRPDLHTRSLATQTTHTHSVLCTSAAHIIIHFSSNQRETHACFTTTQAQAAPAHLRSTSPNAKRKANTHPPATKMSTENSEFAVPEVVAAEEKEATKEIKGTKRPAEVSKTLRTTPPKPIFMSSCLIHTLSLHFSLSSLRYCSHFSTHVMELE